MKFNPRYHIFKDVLDERAGDWLQPWKGESWRFQDINFSSEEETLSGDGAQINGGRFNHKGTIPAVYGSLEQETALAESNARAKRSGLTIRKPRTFVCIGLNLKKVLDLRQPSFRKKLGITLKELAEEDWENLQDHGTESVSQALGRAAADAGAEAIIIRSFARSTGFNAVFFPVNKVKGSKVSIFEGGKLPDKRKHVR